MLEQNNERGNIVVWVLAAVLVIGGIWWFWGRDSGDDMTMNEPSERIVYAHETVQCPDYVNFSGFADTEVQGSTYECGVVTVPENYDEPDGRQIELVYLRLFTTGEENDADPLLYLSGGPGGSAVHELSPGPVGFLYESMKEIRKDRDVIAYDQRGTGYSNPLVCGPTQAALGIGAEVLPGFSEQLAEIEKSDGNESTMLNIALCASLYTLAGVDLSQYNSVVSSQDMASLMTTLGYDTYGLYGTSYGTKLAQVALRETPDRISAAVMDGTTPITGAVLASVGTEWQEQLGRIFEQCTADEACAAAYPNLQERFAEVVKKIAEKPIAVNPPIKPTGYLGVQYPGKTVSTLDPAFIGFLVRANNTIPNHVAESRGLFPVLGQMPAIILALEENDIEKVRSILEGPPSFAAEETGGLVMQEIADERAILPDNQYVAKSITTLLNAGQALFTLGQTSTPREKWITSVLASLEKRLEAGEEQAEVVKPLLVFSVLPVGDHTREALLAFTEEHLTEEERARVDPFVSEMTDDDIRALMWQISEVATTMGDQESGVTDLHELITYGINCAESVVFHVPGDVTAFVTASPFPELADFDAEEFELFEKGCSFFPQSNITKSFLDPVRSDTPGLVLQGALDTQTPLSGAQEVASYLSNGKIVVFDSEGHVVAAKDPSGCPGKIAAQFLDDPEGELDTSCADEFKIIFALPQ